MNSPALSAISPAKPKRRYLKFFGIAVLTLLVVGFIAFQVAIHFVKKEIAAFLGPLGEVKELNVGLTGVEIVGIRLPAKDVPGWPAENLLQAKRVIVTPSLGALLGGRIAVSGIHVEDGYLSMLRTKNGKMEILPTILSRSKNPSAQNSALFATFAALAGKMQSGCPALFPTGLPDGLRAACLLPMIQKAKAETDNMPEVTIDHITLENSAIEFFDASISRTPLKIRMEQIKARVDQLHFPDLKGNSQISLEAVIKGKSHDGQLWVGGWMEFASKDSDLRLKLQRADLVPLQAYLVQAADAGVSQGSLSLDLQSRIQKGILHAPGTLILDDFELSSGGQGFMGVPRTLVVALMKDKKGQINLQFTLDGNINDPHFSLNENIASKISVAFAKTLGVGLGGLIENIGKNFSGGANAIGNLLRH